jgi:hypothetical protein
MGGDNKLSVAIDTHFIEEGKQEVVKVCSDFKEDSFISPTRIYDSYIDYHNVIPKINYRGNKIIAVIVHDQRPYILSREKDTEYVGLYRGGFGKPNDIKTSTLMPLADEFSQSIVNGLLAAGFKTMESSSTNRIVSIDILEWLTVTGGGITGGEIISFTSGTDLYYKLVVKVFDEKNNILIQQEVKGTDRLGGNLTQIYELIPKATENIFNKIFNSPDIRKVLTE